MFGGEGGRGGQPSGTNEHDPRVHLFFVRLAGRAESWRDMATSSVASAPALPCSSASPTPALHVACQSVAGRGEARRAGRGGAGRINNKQHDHPTRLFM